MSHIDELLVEVHRLPAGTPTNPRELAEHLGRLKTVAAWWADVLLEVSEASRGLASAPAAAAMEIAFRRAEESFVELQIAHTAASGTSGR
ncbi:hypothetical protein [Kitasatospora sp. GAS1066B]|uniref:hypothetical protein n=1 Tax=Kitasatospora sp. GAS1066B TaxID=3156271 RepID=UPI003514B311